MASLSLSAGAVPSISPRSAGSPRHVRKHSRTPSALPLPSFTFNPGADLPQSDPSEEKENMVPDTDDPPSPPPAKHLFTPAPLPAFKFNPGADLPAPRSPSPTHPILEEMERNQRRAYRSARPAPLSMYTLDLPKQEPFTSSPTKPSQDTSDASKPPSGHRRGGSEFVGGKSDHAQLISVSPQKSDGRPHPPVTAGRGHMHRRSQAISISDIDTSDLIKQHAVARSRAGSNPSTPSRTQSYLPPRDTPDVNSYTTEGSRSQPGSPRRRGSIPGQRQRVVDFSEKIDFIPRPLSMISSETERSNSTIRGHSLSNSINSIASPTPISTPHEPPILEYSPSEHISAPRPTTADAAGSLGVGAKSGREDMLSLPKRPLSASNSPIVASSGSPPAKKKHFWSNYGSEASPLSTPQSELSDPFCDRPVTSSATIVPRLDTRHERPSMNKRRKYHTWTAGIFAKKSKHKSSTLQSRASPSRPTVVRRDSDLVNELFDADDTVVLREESPVVARHEPVVPQSYLTPPIPTSPAIDGINSAFDLDAAFSPDALGDRNSSDLGRSTASRMARLHSSERRGVTDAFGVVHRRAESAPAMPAVNRTLLGVGQHGSAASLSIDVFDEEEEDDFLAREQKNKSIQRETTNLTPKAAKLLDGGLGLHHVQPLTDDVVIVDPDNDHSSQYTALHTDDALKRPATSPMSFAYAEPAAQYASSTEARTTTASLISSPDVDHVTFENQIKFQRSVNSGPDVFRRSNDDLPSLSDSVSTGLMARVSEAGHVRPSLEQRSHSMFLSGTTQRNDSWKRASLASLNRLIPGSSHGSKLKFETPPSSIHGEKPKKKTNRLSKLMTFWRSKENSA